MKFSQWTSLQEEVHIYCLGEESNPTTTHFIFILPLHAIETDIQNVETLNLPSLAWKRTRDVVLVASNFTHDKFA